MSGKRRSNFLIVSVIIIIIVLAFALFVAFCIERAYFAGRNLQKPNTSFSTTDVIGVYSAVITFLGTSILGVVALWQNLSMRDELEAIERQKAELEVEPIFVLDLLGIDKRLPNTSIVRSFDNDPKYLWDNFALKIRNCGARAVFNVIFCEVYIQDVLVPNQSVDVYVSYDESVSNNSLTEGLISIDSKEYSPSECKYPSLLVIGYNDVYGNNKIQQLKLRENLKRYFYAKQDLDEKFD